MRLLRKSRPTGRKEWATSLFVFKSLGFLCYSFFLTISQCRHSEAGLAGKYDLMDPALTRPSGGSSRSVAPGGGPSSGPIYPRTWAPRSGSHCCKLKTRWDRRDIPAQVLSGRLYHTASRHPAWLLKYPEVCIWWCLGCFRRNQLLLLLYGVLCVAFPVRQVANYTGTSDDDPALALSLHGPGHPWAGAGASAGAGGAQPQIRHVTPPSLTHPTTLHYVLHFQRRRRQPPASFLSSLSHSC